MNVRCRVYALGPSAGRPRRMAPVTQRPHVEVGDDRSVQLDERRRRFGPDVVAQRGPVGLERAQRPGGAAGLAQRPHQQAAWTVAAWVLADQGRQHGDRGCVVAGVQEEHGQVLDRRSVKVTEPSDLDLRPRLVGELVVRRPLPQHPSVLEGASGRLGVGVGGQTH